MTAASRLRPGHQLVLLIVVSLPEFDSQMFTGSQLA